MLQSITKATGLVKIIAHMELTKSEPCIEVVAKDQNNNDNEELSKDSSKSTLLDFFSN